MSVIQISKHLDVKNTHVADIIEGVKFWREATVDAEELLVHDSGEGKGAEGRHASVVDSLRVLALAFVVRSASIGQEGKCGRTFELESEVVRQMPTFMVASKKEKGIWVPHFQGPQVQHALLKYDDSFYT